MSYGRSVESYLAAVWILTVFNQQRANYVPDLRLVHFGGQDLILSWVGNDKGGYHS
jgi:hypothetical protein